MHLFVTTKNHLPLAERELISLFGDIKRDDGKRVYGANNANNLFLVKKKVDEKLVQRLAYTSSVHKVLVEASSLRAVVSEIKKYDWEKVVDKTFCVRSYVGDLREKDIAELVWNKLKYPKVNLSNPRTLISLFSFNSGGNKNRNKYLVSTRVWENELGFMQRKPHMRKCPHPTSIDPRLALACVNITGIKKGIILDPFCGTGGFLIEAGLLNMNVVGFDIDDVMLKRTESNLREQAIRKFKLFKRDASDLGSYDLKFDAIVSDLPYGKASKLHNRERDELYNSFLATIKTVKARVLKEYGKSIAIVIIFPDSVSESFVARHFKIGFMYSYYIHRSLSRRIFVLE